MNLLPILSKAAAGTAAVYLVLGLVASTIAVQVAHLPVGRWATVVLWLGLGVVAAAAASWVLSHLRRNDDLDEHEDDVA